MKLQKDFFERDGLAVSQDLLGKYLVRQFNDGTLYKGCINDIEFYSDSNDLASHSRFGVTSRNKIMYESGGYCYVYLVYGMYWMLNIVTGNQHDPQAILIRGTTDISGPGKLGRILQLDGTFYGEYFPTSTHIWIEDQGVTVKNYEKLPRVGVDYAGTWAKKPWRFFARI